MEDNTLSGACHELATYILPVRFNDDSFFEISLVQSDDKIYLTDRGKTLEELDKIFELSEPDVVKNLLAILAQYEVNKIENKCVLEVSPWTGNTNENENEHLKKGILTLYACLSFMLNMKIFYV